MFTTFVCCSRCRRAGNSGSRRMFTLWPFKWTLLLLFMLFMNNVAAKWPPDAPQSRFYQQNWPRHYFDDFAIDSSDFGNENSIGGSGNALFDKAIADEIALRAADGAVPAEERRQSQLQWLANWLFGQRQQNQQQTKQNLQQMQEANLRMQLQQPVYWQKQQQQLPHSNGIRINDAGIVVYKKAPEIVLGEEEKLSLGIDGSENDDITDTKAVEEVAEQQVTPMDTIFSDYDYDKSDMDSAAEQFNIEQLSRSKRIFYPRRNRRLDYAYIPYTAYQHERERELAEAKKLALKRNKTGNGDRRNFLPSISAGAMTHLGNFFTDLSKNVRYNEKSQPLGHEEAKLLEGQHPLRQLHEKIAGEHEANAEFLHAIRTYRPSQKIRSLVAMNPRGYHGAQFIDPNYMWVGLGK